MEQSGSAPEAVPLPRGGGAIRGIGDTFAPDLHTGTGSYRVRLWCPRGPGGFQPDLGLVYSSGAGNGPYGLGWHLPVLTVRRRTDRALPRYDDLDTLLLDSEELAPLGGGRYRARREEQFRRVTATRDGFTVQDRGGRTFTLTDRVEHDGRTLAWLVTRAADRNGNAVDYQYLRDQGMLYLSEISYGPYRLAFRYEQRPDVLTDRRPGFDLTTALRLNSVDYLLADETEPFRTYRLGYTQCPHTLISLLAEVTCTGHRDGKSTSLPKLRLGYTPYEPGRRYRAVRSAPGSPLPSGLADPSLDLVDLLATGLPGVVQLTGLTHRYWPNHGGSFGAARTLRRVPAPLTLADPAVAFADMDGTGTADLLLLRDAPFGYLENAPGQGPVRRTRWRRPPAFAPDDPEVRLLDLNGDGLVDAVRTGRHRLYLYQNRGPDGWAAPVGVPRASGHFPDVFFSDPRVKLADLTGDGLTDIALCHGGRIDYWPHYGNGRFGPRLTLGLTPALGRDFDPRRLLLMDVNGDGLADVVYVDDGRVLVWANRGGTALALAAEVRHTPRESGVQAGDLLGTGTAGLVWSGSANYRHLDLTGGIRPYLLSTIDDGTGLVTEVNYRPSTEHMVRAAADGDPWRTTLPFPVQTVSRLVQRDAVTGTTTTRSIRYHDGLFDGRRREFRGFGRVEVTEEGPPSARTTSWFHQDDVLAGRLARLEVTEPGDGRPFRVEENTYLVRDPEPGVRFAHLASSTVRVDERGHPPVTNTTTLEYNDLGNVVAKHELWDAGTSVRELHTTMRYTEDTARWILSLPVEKRQTAADGTVLALHRFHYDGAPFTGLPLGQVERGNLTRREDLVLTDALVTAAYGAQPPDFRALGHHRMDDGWGVDGLADGHDSRGNPDRRRNPLGHLGTITYDQHGLSAVKITDPMGHEYTVGYDLRAAEVSEVGDANGAVTRYLYDPLGRLAATVKPGDSTDLPTSTYTYDDVGCPLSVGTSLRVTSGQPDTADSVEYFDGFGRTVQRRSAAGNGHVLVDAHRIFDERGLEADRSVPFRSTGFGYVAHEGQDQTGRYRFAYDALNRVITTRTPDGLTSTVSYVPGRVTRHDVRGTERVDHVDAKGRLLAVEEGTLLTRYGYDELGRLTSITDARGVLIAEYLYDLLGRKIQVDHVDAGRRRAAHNARGDLVVVHDAAGHRVELSYDAVGRQSSTTVDGLVTETFRYDSGAGSHLLGRLALVEDPSGETRYSYTRRGLVEQKTRVPRTLAGSVSLTTAYSYDAQERMTSVTDPSGVPIDYEYDARGLVTRIPGFVAGFEYNAIGQLTALRYANGTTSSFDYDPATFYLRQARISGPTSVPLLRTDYTYDAVGNPLTITDGQFDRTCSYDAHYRLTAVTGTADGAGFTHAYSYDDAGNLRRNDEFGPGEFVVEPGTDRLRGVRSDGVETVLFAHDASGHLTAAPGLRLTFDPRGRLVRALKDDGTVVEYAYDHVGMRVRKRVTPAHGPAVETLYADGRYEVRGGAVTRYVTHGDSRLVAVDEDGPKYLHHDVLGHLVLVTGSQGQVLLRLGHHAYGTRAFAAGSATVPYRFLGNELEETGLVYCRSRYYHPGLGRFVSPDLFVILNPERVLALPSALNPYAYASNNPLRQADPDGAWWKWVVGALIIAALVVTTVVVGVFTGGAGFAFGILLAASIGSALGAGVGTYSAWRGGGDLADGFLFGALVGAAAGAAGYAAGAAVGAAGISGVWGSVLAGAAQGAVAGAGNGAIVGFAGGAGSMQDIIVAMAAGFVIGAVLGGISGYLRYSPTDVKGALVGRAGEMPVQQVDPVTGKPLVGPAGQPFTQNVPIPEPARTFWQSVAGPPATLAQGLVNAAANPLVAGGVGATTQAALWHDWDAIKAWLLDTFGGDDQTIVAGG